MIQWSAWGSCRANITGTSTTTTTSSSSSSTATSSSTSKSGQSTCRRARGSWFPKAWFIALARRTGRSSSWSKPRPSFRPGMPRRPSVQRLELDDRGAVVAADPEGHRRGRVVDEHAPDVGVARQQVVDHPAALGVEARDEVGDHRAGPGLLVLVDRDVVGRGPARLDLPVLELAGLGVEHGDAVAAVLREPEPVLRVHHAAPRRGDLGRGRYLEHLHLAALRVDAPDMPPAEV